MTRFNVIVNSMKIAYVGGFIYGLTERENINKYNLNINKNIKHIFICNLYGTISMLYPITIPLSLLYKYL
jgi:hypothetical protein